MNRFNFFQFYLMTILLIATSCGASKNFNKVEVQKDYSALLDTMGTKQHVLKPDDKISLSIWNHDDLSVGSLFTIYNSHESFGKWVLINSKGEVSFPKLGLIKLGGLTLSQAEDTLVSLYSVFLLNPIIKVRLLNKEVTILGEVKSPGNYLLDEEKNTLVTLIGKAEGMLYYAQTKKIRFIRDDKMYQLNLDGKDQLKLLQINLKDGDIIHVPARPGKTIEKKAPTLIPIASTLTAIVLLGTLLTR